MQSSKICQVFILVLTSLTVSVSGQNRRDFAPVWTYHEHNINIHGISIGIASVRGEPRNTNTNGIKIEVVGVGIAMLLIPESPLAKDDSSFVEEMSAPVSERINGLNLSLTGTACDCTTNGISAGLVGQVNLRMNGISVSAYMNFAEAHNGIQASIFMNESNKVRGLQIGAVNSGRHVKGVQIGLSNKSRDFKGIQIGLWNVNEKRKLPFLNWNFK